MPYKYFGKTTSFKGKTLWEIVGNLKNFGVGRVVVRSTFERYPEPSYFRILKVETLPCPEVQNLDNLRKVRVLVEKTFRGVTQPKPTLIESVSYKPDYRLIPKDEEQVFCKTSEAKSQARVLPETADFPPLLKEYLLREMKLKGENVPKDLKLPLVYKRNPGKYKIAEDGEKPQITINLNDGTKLPNISLYKNVNVNI